MPEVHELKDPSASWDDGKSNMQSRPPKRKKPAGGKKSRSGSSEAYEAATGSNKWMLPG